MVRRLCMQMLSLVGIVLGVTIMTFLLIRVAPGKPEENIALSLYGQDYLTEELIEEVRIERELYLPLHQQYWNWLKGLLQGDLGVSISYETPVMEEIFLRFPTTFRLAISALVVSLLMAVPLGICAARHQNSLIDRLITSMAMLGESLPGFWVGLLLIILLAVELDLLPAFGTGTPAHFVMPVATLSIGMCSVLLRLTRNNMLDALGQEYILSAKSRGLSNGRIMICHALGHTLLPVLTMTGQQFAGLMEGTVVVESIFGIPGIGKLLVDAIFSRDYPLIQGCVLVFGVLVVLINTLTDVMYGILDPRIRSRRKSTR